LAIKEMPLEEKYNQIARASFLREREFRLSPNVKKER